MNSKPTLLFFLLLLPALTFSQGVRGTVIDENGDPLPMVSIYLPAERVGTTTNLNGEYEIHLNPGEYDLIFRSLGFSQREFKLTIRQTWIDLDVTLQPQSYQLQEVLVNPSGEDPAYAIMRKAIGMAPYYLRQTEQYTAEVYLKGSFRMDKIPRLLRSSLKMSADDAEVQVEEGRTYTMESMNQVVFIAPDTFKHTVLASRSSFPAGDESSALGFINSSFYEPDNGMVISPLAPRAMRHYNYRYEGFFDESGVEVNKIKVIPKRKSQQLVSGYVFIVQDLWNLHSVDVDAEMFFGDMRVKQVFQPVSKNVWLPVTYQFDLDVSIMGVKAVVDYAGSVKYTDVKIDENLPAPGFLEAKLAHKVDDPPDDDEGVSEDKPTKDEPDKNQQVIDKLLEKDKLNNREMMKLARLMGEASGKDEKPASLELTSTYQMDVMDDSLVRDSVFWNRKRPVPLTIVEQQSFARRDSLVEVGKRKADTTEQKKAGILKKAAMFSLWGRRFHFADSTVSVSYNGLAGLGNIGFNPVDGWIYKQSLNIRWQQDSVHRMVIQPEVIWAFSRERFMWNIALSQSYAPMQRGQFRLTAGDITSDFKGGGIAVKPFADMTASLLFKENYKRFYSREFIEFQNGLDIINGLRWNISTEYQWANPLENHTNYSFFRKDEDYHRNVPRNNALGDGALDARNSLTWRTSFFYTPRHFYRVRRGRKIMAHSDYPTFFVALEHGVKALDSDADFLLVEGGVRQEKKADFFPAFSWAANAGWFASDGQMHFSDYKHFNASLIPVRLSGGPAFWLMDDYRPSTNEWYVTGHFKYTSPYLLLKRLPVLSNRLWQESLHLDYLHTPEVRNYFQAGYSIDQILFMGSVGVFAGFEDGIFSAWGVRGVLKF